MRDTGVEAQQLTVCDEQKLIATITFIRADDAIAWEIDDAVTPWGGEADNVSCSSTGVLKYQERERLHSNLKEFLPEEIRDNILNHYDNFVSLCDSVQMSINDLKKQSIPEKNREIFIAALCTGSPDFFEEKYKNFATMVFAPENRASWYNTDFLNQSQRG